MKEAAVQGFANTGGYWDLRSRAVMKKYKVHPKGEGGVETRSGKSSSRLNNNEWIIISAAKFGKEDGRGRWKDVTQVLRLSSKVGMSPSRERTMTAWRWWRVWTNEYVLTLPQQIRSGKKWGLHRRPNFHLGKEQKQYKEAKKWLQDEKLCLQMKEHF